MATTNLPVQLTSFIGREHELAELIQILTTSNLITLTGAGGCGKTRLALQVANAVSDHFKDGVWLVELASLRDPSLITPHITQIINLPRKPDQQAFESMINHLQSKEILLVLDNCEHLIADCAQLVQRLLSQTFTLRILATSREPLSIAGEVIYPISGLTWPSTDTELKGKPQDFLQYDAVRLFVERARAVLPNFTITDENALSVVQVCHRLDGLPLALELASARSNILSLQQIAERLNDRFNFLISKKRNEPDQRHHTLQATMDWSYDLLSASEQILLRRISAFAGGCSLDAVEAVCAGDGVEVNDILELLDSLVNKSLVNAQTHQRREARYSLLETIQDYAQGRLRSSGDWSRTRDQHLQYFLKLAEETAPKLIERHQQVWLNWLNMEHPNLRVALAWSIEDNQIETGLRIAIALHEYWQKRGYAQEGLDWLEQLLVRAEEKVSLIVRAKAFAYAAFLAMLLGNTSATIKYGRKAGALGQATGIEEPVDTEVALLGLANMANSVRAACDYRTAFIMGEHVIRQMRASGEVYLLGRILIMQAGTAMALGRYGTVRVLLDEGLKLAQEAGDTFRVAVILNFLGDLARCEQDFALAKANYENSIALLRELDARRDLASALQNLGHAYLHLGEVELSRPLFVESLALQQEQKNSPGMAECLIGFAAIALLHHLSAAGARLLSAAIALGGERPANLWTATRLEYERYLELAQKELGEEEFQAEQAEGRALSLEQAIEYAQGLPLQPREKARKNPDDLTGREQEIAMLIAQGKSNGQIANELVVSKRTVEKHVSNILAKLGVIDRIHIVRWVIQSGMLKITE